jgi:hypothetical protein
MLDVISRFVFLFVRLQGVGNPSEGEYLNHPLTYKPICLYNSINAWSKTGVVAAFFLNNGQNED